MEELTRHLTEVLEKALDSGFKLPFYLVAVSLNGNMVFSSLLK